MTTMQFFKKRHAFTLLFLASVAIPVTALAEPSACTEMLAKQGLRLSNSADKALQNHVADVQKLYQNHPISNDPKDDLVFQQLLADAELDAARRELIDEVVGQLNAMDFSTGSGNSCPPRLNVRRAYDMNLESYQQILDGIEEMAGQLVDARKLEDNEGLWLAVIQSEVPVRAARLTRQGSSIGATTLYSIRPGNHMRLLTLTAGTYNWNQLQWGAGDGRSWLDLKSDDTAFEIKPGVLNYAGVLDVQLIRENVYSVELHDRLTVVISLIEERMPALLGEFEIANGLTINDEFLDFYIEERRTLKARAVQGTAE